MSQFFIRELNESDYLKGYTNLMGQLTDVGQPTEKQFWNLCHYLSCTVYHSIYVLIDGERNRLVGSGTLLIEPKFIHGCSKLAHIEDIIIDKKYHGMGLGKKMVRFLVDNAHKQDCYKVRLICKDDVKGFYERCGFQPDQIGMMVKFR
jgi:glucosamine-phosphate N-acetyltransferase